MQPDFNMLTDPLWRMVVPVVVAMAMGLVSLASVTLIMRKGFSRRVSFVIGEAACGATVLGCLYVGFALPHGGSVSKAVASLGNPPPASIERQFSTEPRCKWAVEEARRLASSNLNPAVAVTTASALRQKASEASCLATRATTYPSMGQVEGYVFRLKDGDECRWARDGFMLIASRNLTGNLIQDILEHRKRTETAGCFRY